MTLAGPITTGLEVERTDSAQKKIHPLERGAHGWRSKEPALGEDADQLGWLAVAAARGPEAVCCG